MAWGKKGMQKRREDKEQERHTRGAVKKKAIKEQTNGVNKNKKEKKL